MKIVSIIYHLLHTVKILIQAQVFKYEIFSVFVKTMIGVHKEINGYFFTSNFFNSIIIILS